MNRVALRNVTLEVGDRVLCRDLSLDINAGENWAILGANGSGKTTLLHAIAGLTAPARGSILLDGRDLRSWPGRERARQIGLLFQDYGLIFPTTVLETVLTGRHPHLSRWAFEDDEDIRRAKDALHEVGLTGFEERLVSTLSGGERRRMEIAALLAQDAPVCLWDEPANHLDLRHRGEILRKLTARTARPGHLNIVVLHDVNAAWQLCTHALLLFADGATASGRMSEILTPDALQRLYGCAFRVLVEQNERYFLSQ